MPKKCEYGLLIDYEYCTGCYSCQVACAQEYKWPAGMGGIQVMEVVQKLPNDKAYLAYLPFPTEFCDLCLARTGRGEPPACVKHCQAWCMYYGTVAELAEVMEDKPRSVLFSH